MTKDKLIVDTSFWISYLINNDINHFLSMKFVDSSIRKGEIFISNYILMEIYTVISQKMGKVYLNDIVKKKIFSNSNVIVLFVNEKDNSNIYKEYLKINIKDASFVDLSILYIAKKHGLKILTFDKHFKKLGREYSVQIIGC